MTRKSADSSLRYVEEKYKEFLRTEGQADALASVDVIQGLDMFVQKGTSRPSGAVWRCCQPLAVV